jgi:DinB superfamily
MSSASDLLDLSDLVFARTRARIEGLGDDEYLWEPVTPCWSVRIDADGEPRADGAPMPDAPPFTTIAWRLHHLTGCYGAARNARWLTGAGGDGDAGPGAPRAAAGEAVKALDEAHRYWRSLLATLTDADLTMPLGPRGGQYAESSRGAFALHMIDEFIHHGAEVDLLRDLHAATVVRPPLDPAVAAVLRGQRPTAAEADRLRAERPDLVRWVAANGYWPAVPVLVELGFDLDAARDGATALHHAAAAGELATTRLLVEHGAAQDVHDDRFRATPQGWAEYFGHRRVADHLRG